MEQINRKTVIRKENNSFFCINDINGYIELFDKYKDKKVIQNKFFSDNVWILSYDNNQKKHCRRFHLIKFLRSIRY